MQSSFCTARIELSDQQGQLEGVYQRLKAWSRKRGSTGSYREHRHRPPSHEGTRPSSSLPAWALSIDNGISGLLWLKVMGTAGSRHTQVGCVTPRPPMMLDVRLPEYS